MRISDSGKCGQASASFSRAIRLGRLPQALTDVFSGVTAFIRITAAKENDPQDPGVASGQLRRGIGF
ncbi:MULTISPECIES: hypothetical protein [Chitinophaga]|uniref:hypothetical protein n=1 Tax=Chitinophaga TaxID=79328 RepID=UPI001057E8AA|nr:hypothetical protein [Chitinophaga ginsengisegetis]MDR6649763.1 hypothetical protein [Chitinophaga ginsengisegetis]MDR6656034.1 hypothetical protein [Chitinophaga ginsengisegetis]